MSPSLILAIVQLCSAEPTQAVRDQGERAEIVNLQDECMQYMRRCIVKRRKDKDAFWKCSPDAIGPWQKSD